MALGAGFPDPSAAELGWDDFDPRREAAACYLIGASALAVGAGVSSIQGQVDSNRITGVVDIDVYRLDLPAGDFSAAVTVSSDLLDTALVLFDGTGRGLRADDDSGADVGACVDCARVGETLATAGT